MGCYGSVWLTTCGEKSVPCQERGMSLQRRWSPGYLTSSQRGGKPPFSVYLGFSLTHFITQLFFQIKDPGDNILNSSSGQPLRGLLFLARVSEKKSDLFFLHGKVGHKLSMASGRSRVDDFMVLVQHHLFLTMNLLPLNETDGKWMAPVWGDRCASELRSASDRMASQRCLLQLCNPRDCSMPGSLVLH